MRSTLATVQTRMAVEACSRIDISMVAHNMSQTCATTNTVQILLRSCCRERALIASVVRAKEPPSLHITKKETNSRGYRIGVRVQRACLDCRRLTTSTRCHNCSRLFKERYKGDWARQSRAQRQAEPLCDWCGRTEDLVADHLVPGKVEYGIRTLCRSCNSRRASGGAGQRGG